MGVALIFKREKLVGKKRTVQLDQLDQWKVCDEQFPFWRKSNTAYFSRTAGYDIEQIEILPGLA